MKKRGTNRRERMNRRKGGRWTKGGLDGRLEKGEEKGGEQR